MSKYIKNFSSKQLSQVQNDVISVSQSYGEIGDTIPLVYVYDTNKVHITKVIRQSHSG